MRYKGYTIEVSGGPNRLAHRYHILNKYGEYITNNGYRSIKRAKARINREIEEARYADTFSVLV